MFGSGNPATPVLYNKIGGSCNSRDEQQQVVGHQTAGFGRSEADQSELPMITDLNQQLPISATSCDAIDLGDETSVGI